jgi:hypothetical protein
LPFEIKIQISKSRRVRKQVVLTGKWKLRQRLNVSFEIDYGKRQVRSLHFSTTFRINSKNQVVMSLEGARRQALGIELVFTRRFWKDAEFFLRFRREQSGSAIETGTRIPF